MSQDSERIRRRLPDYFKLIKEPWHLVGTMLDAFVDDDEEPVTPSGHIRNLFHVAKALEDEAAELRSNGSASTLIQELVTEREAHRQTRERLKAVEGERDTWKQGAEAEAENSEAWKEAEVRTQAKLRAAEAERDALKAEVADLRAGKCRCWQEPGSSERQHAEHCPEQAALLMCGYCDRIKGLIVERDALKAELADATRTIRQWHEIADKYEDRWVGQRLLKEKAEAALAEAQDHARQLQKLVWDNAQLAHERTENLKIEYQESERKREAAESALREKEEQVKVMAPVINWLRCGLADKTDDSYWMIAARRIAEMDAALTVKPQEKADAITPQRFDAMAKAMYENEKNQPGLIVGQARPMEKP